MQPTPYPPGARRLLVLLSAPVTPRMRRVVLGGDGLTGFTLDPAWWGAYVKLLVPQQDRPPVRRTYSVRLFDPAANRLEIDVVILEPRGYPFCWAASAGPGDEVGLLGPGAAEPWEAWRVRAVPGLRAVQLQVAALRLPA